MADPVAFKILEELGVLVRSTRVLPDTPSPAPAAHALSRHTPAWAFENPTFARPFEDQNLAICEVLPRDLSPDQVLAKTRLAVFVGAADSPEFRAFFDRPDTVVLVFEPEAAKLSRLVSHFKPRDLAGKNLFLFLGDPAGFRPALAAILPPETFLNGFPVFYLREDIEPARPAFVRDVVEQLEFLFFRYRIYPISGQFNMYGLPLREITRGLFFDQQKHAYENTIDCMRQGNLQQLKDFFRGRTALLVAAGQDLERRIEYVRANRDKALVIAVNNALKPLLAHGVTPHFVVLNDTSLAIEESFEGLAPLPETILVGHCLSHLGGEKFARKFLFGNWKPEVLGVRPTLRLHGSVITSAFSLARFLGCTACVLVAVQLASADPWTLGYARGTIYDDRGPRHAGPLTDRFPQLYPVTNRFGITLYTSLNFRDACLWFLDEIRSSRLRCVNLTRESILHGDGVEYDENFAITGATGLKALLARARALPPAPGADPAKVRAHLAQELTAWRNTADPVGQVLSLRGEEFLRLGLDVLRQLDAGNVSYLVQRFRDFDNRRFHAQVFQGRDPAEREEGLRYYLEYVVAMARHFIDILEAQQRELGL